MKLDISPMLNAYPDSMGGTLHDIVQLLARPEFENVFGSFYILPSVFNTDLDRGFSVIDYTLNRELAGPQDMEGLKALGLKLKLDFILNHASVLSPQFQDLLKNGKSSVYRDFFIDWNDFWQGCGSMTEQGYIQPEAKYLEKMLFRKPGLPILMARMPDGTEEPYWNTFYQQVDYLRPTVQQLMQISGLQYSAAVRLHSMLTAALNAGQKPDEINFGKYAACKSVVINWLEEHREYLGQMDLNIKSPIVWEFYRNTLQTLAGYGASIVRLDAFAYAPKEPGEKNFLNDPATWELLDKVKVLADEYGLQLLPEIHASYSEKIYQTVADKGYMTYDFFLPGLVLDAIENKDGSYLAAWADELRDHQIHTVNMLGCHDGIPLLDLKGLLPEERIQSLIGTIVARGGMVKDLHGQKNIYYQVNATYYSALGADDDKIYEPGELVGVGYDADGQEIYRTSVRTADAETVLTVKTDKNILRAGGQDFCFADVYVTDKNGTVKLLPDYDVKIEVVGAASLQGYGSAAYKNAEHYDQHHHKSWQGHLQAVLRSTEKTGPVTVTFTADGCAPAILHLSAE